MADQTSTPVVKLDGSALDAGVAADLIELRVEQHLDQPMAASFAVFDPGYERFDDELFLVGASLEVQLPGPDGALQTAFEGDIVEVGIEHPDGGADAPHLRVGALDKSHRLLAASTFAAYVDRTPRDVVEAIADAHGLQSTITIPSERNATQTFQLQAMSDHAMLCHLARVLGCEWSVRGSELHFGERADAVVGPLSYDDGTLLRFSARYVGTGVPKAVHVLGWDPAQQAAVDGVAATAEQPEQTVLRSNAPFALNQHGKAVTAFGSPLRVAGTPVRNQSDAEGLATVLAEQRVGGGLHAEGVATCDPRIVAGGSVTIEKVGTKLSGSYYVTDVVHEFGGGRPVRTSFASRPGLRGDGGRSGDVAGDPDSWGRVGVVLGKVSNVKDPQRAGRVKVALKGISDQIETDWARVVTSSAGANHGVDVRPEVNEEVVVVFDRGDPRFAYVLGSVWSTQVKPPDADVVDDDGGVVTKRVIRSRVGHTVVLSDGEKSAAAGDASRFVEIKVANGKATVHVGEDGITIEADSVPLELKAGQASVKLDQDKLELKGSEITLTSTGAMKLEAQGAANLKGTGGVTVDGAMAKAEVKGSMIDVKASGITKVGGAMVQIN